jgi:hypothetical protein
VRHGEIRRLALAVRAGRHALAANRAQLQTIVDEVAPGLTERRGIGAVTAAQAPSGTVPDTLTLAGRAYKPGVAGV